MSKTFCAATLVGLMTLAASAPGWAVELSDKPADPAAALTPTTDAAPKGLISNTQSGLYLGLDGFGHVTQNETMGKLGEGLSAGFYSSQYTTPGAVNATMRAPAGPSSQDPLGRFSPNLPALNSSAAIGPATGLNTNLYNGYDAGQSFSTFGGQVSQDLGGGVSVNFVGGVTRDPNAAYTLGPRGGLNMTSGGQMSASAGAGVTLDVGGGSSLSLSGTVSHTSANARCAAGLAIGLCR